MTSKTLWHRILGRLLEMLLTPEGVTVLTDFEVMSDPPRIDILLLRREQPHWTAAQRALLPDGIRDSQAQQILVEFKYSESLNRERLRKVQGYAAFYREVQRLNADELHCFIVSAKTPRRNFLQTYGYVEGEQAGVYHSQNPLLADIPLLALNGLADQPYNAYLKCFASRQVEREKAFERLAEGGFIQVGKQAWSYLMGLRQTFRVKGDTSAMKIEITPEDIMDLGEGLRARLLETIPVEERLMGLKPEERLMGLKPEERLMGLKPEERLMGLKPEERLVGLKPEERLVGLKPEERLVGMEDYLVAQQQKAKQEALVESLIRILQVRFDLSQEVGEAYSDQCQSFDLAVLEALEEIALKVADSAAFDEALAKFLPPDPPPA